MHDMLFMIESSIDLVDIHGSISSPITPPNKISNDIEKNYQNWKDS